MIRLTTILLLVAFASACGKKENKKTPSAETTPAVQVAPETPTGDALEETTPLPVSADFEDEVEAGITKDNYESELEELAKEIETDG